MGIPVKDLLRHMVPRNVKPLSYLLDSHRLCPQLLFLPIILQKRIPQPQDSDALSFGCIEQFGMFTFPSLTALYENVPVLSGKLQE